MDLLLALAFAAAAAATVPLQSQEPCAFAFAHSPAEQRLLVAGPEEIVARTRRMDQPELPIVITHADFSKFQLTLGPGTHAHDGAYTLRIINVSDREVSDIVAGSDIWFVGTATGGGTYGRFPGTLKPGQSETIRIMSRGQGSTPSGAETELTVSVRSLTIGGCRYEAARRREAGSGCTFDNGGQPASQLVVTGPPEIASRTRRMHQPNSPVVITRADFSQSRLLGGSGAFTFNKGYTIELLNLSSETVRDIDVGVQLNFVNGSGGGGGGGRFTGALAPGARGTFSVTNGRTMLSDQNGADVTLDLFVKSLLVGNCRYEPMQVRQHHAR
jgi:hypothetical protein